MQHFRQLVLNRRKLFFFRPHLKRAPFENPLKRKLESLHDSSLASANRRFLRFVKRRMSFGVLPQEIQNLRADANAVIQIRIRALHVRAQLNQIGGLLIGRQRFADARLRRESLPA